jgi:hypothetical protein
MDAARKTEYGTLLLSLIPDGGASIGNATLREKLKACVSRSGAEELTDQDYWSLRDSLIDEGRIEQGRGRGGSVHRVVAPEAAISIGIAGPVTEPPVEPTVQRILESSLYEPFLRAIIDGYVKDNRIKRFVSEITASQGRRATGGKWTRPDVTIAAVRTYHFTPGKRLEVITFEVKPNLDTAFEGVYEALAHSAFAHRSFLAVHAVEQSDDELGDRISQECSRHGVGYMTFSNPSDYGTYETISNARLREPDPYDVDKFIRTQLNSENQDQLREFLQ